MVCSDTDIWLFMSLPIIPLWVYDHCPGENIPLSKNQYSLYPGDRLKRRQVSRALVRFVENSLEQRGSVVGDVSASSGGLTKRAIAGAALLSLLKADGEILFLKELCSLLYWHSGILLQVLTFEVLHVCICRTTESERPVVYICGIIAFGTQTRRRSKRSEEH